MLLAALLGLTAARPAAAEDAPAYQLGPMDRLRIAVSEWSSAGGEIRTRLTGEFTVDSAGILSMPMLGSMPAAGRSIAELSAAISDRMQERAGLIKPPVTAIEIVQYRPFYILGFVERPGEYPFRPGMTALQAVAVAGGIFRAPNTAHLRLDRDAVAARGEAGQQQARLDELLVRQARVQAELEDRRLVEMPQALAGRADDPVPGQLLHQEQTALLARRDALEALIREQQELRKLAQDEEVSLRDQLKAQEQRLAVVEREADEIRSLKARGLTTTAREFSIAAAAAEVEARRRALFTEILRAGQSIVRAEQAVRQLRTDRRLQLLHEAESLRSQIEDATRRSQMAEQLRDEAESTAQM
ncbi:MAG: polysaccharide biosynthesis/export family protein, partial [Paracraurococcus sp.]